MPFKGNQDNWQKKEVKYKNGGTQQWQQAQLYTQLVAMHHI
jgi:hypothetical protein